MTPLEGKKVLIFQQRSWGKNIGHNLARALAHQGCELHAITISEKSNFFVRSQKEVTYKNIRFMDILRTNPEEYLGTDEFSLTEINQALGIYSIWPLVQSARYHVKSYADKYYYGFKQNKSDEEIILYIKAIYKFVKNCFQDFQPDCILSPNFVGLPHIIFNLYGKKYSVEMIAVSDSKIDGVFYFPKHFQEKESRFIDRFKVLESGERSAQIETAKKFIKEKTNRLLNTAPKAPAPPPLIRRIKNELRPFYISLLHLKNYPLFMDRKDITIDQKPIYYIFRDHFAHKKNTSEVNSYPYFNFDDVKKCIYFPLQFQPEETIDVDAPRFNNQIETARQVAMSLPEDYTLIVKDHPSMLGFRPVSYINKVARTPNVKLVDYRTPTIAILQKADMVISSNGGTILFEAALLGKKSIQLGELGKTLILPNVTHHTNLSTLDAKLVELLDQEIDLQVHNKQLENYVAAMLEMGVKVKYVEAWEGKATDDTQVLIDAWIKEILYSLSKKSSR